MCDGSRCWRLRHKFLELRAYLSFNSCEAIDVPLYWYQLQGRWIRGPRNPAQVCAVLTHPHMQATCSL